MEARFGSFVNHPVFKAVADSLEHRRWPVHDNDALSVYGDSQIEFLAEHFSYLACTESCDTAEALFEWKRLKFEARAAAFFSMPFIGFYEHLSKHYDNSLGYHNLLILVRAALMFVIDTSCCERVYSGVNRAQTKSRASLHIETIRKIFHIQALGPDVKDFDPGPIFDAWVSAPFTAGKGSAKGRQLQAMLREIQKPVTSLSGTGFGSSALLRHISHLRADLPL